MTYVDKGKIPYRGRMKMSHMLADSVGELMEMAEKVGLKPEWFQPYPVPHFDLCQTKRKMALDFGAKEIGWRETALLVRRLRAELLAAHKKSVMKKSVVGS
jgi:hypothetical protein